jgi:hypothetical protein
MRVARLFRWQVLGGYSLRARRANVLSYMVLGLRIALCRVRAHRVKGEGLCSQAR